jgi:hypothetical protein
MLEVTRSASCSPNSMRRAVSCVSRELG